MNQVTKPMYSDEVLKIFRSNLPKEELIEKISDYHMGDIADAFEKMTPGRKKVTIPCVRC